MEVLEIENAVDQESLAAFQSVATRVYQSNPGWVPQSEYLFLQRFSAAKANGQPLMHPVVCLEDGRPLARGAAILVQGSVNEQGFPCGYIAFFECLEQAPQAGQMALKQCERWLVDQGARTVQAPRLDNMQMGMLLKGYELPHLALAAYNPPYYQDILLAQGYHELERFYSYTFSRSSIHLFPLEIPGFRTRTFDRSQLDREASVLHELQYRIFATHLGYVPRTLEEDRRMIEDFLPILDDDLLIIAEDQSGKPVGLIICIPDFLGPYRNPPVKNAILISIGALPELQSKGLGVLMGLHLQRNLITNHYEALEGGWIRANNIMPQNLSRRFKGQINREYALFEKSLLPESTEA